MLNQDKAFTIAHQASMPIATPPFLPPQESQFIGKNTLVVDLDETLVHSCFQCNPHADTVSKIEQDGTDIMIYTAYRPGLSEFLYYASQNYELVIFTASVSSYARQLVDKLCQNAIIAHKLYREHCTFTPEGYVKDLSLLGRDVHKVIIVDNSPISYKYQPLNAIPISNWYGDANDRELTILTTFLEKLASSSNVYTDIPKYIGSKPNDDEYPAELIPSTNTCPNLDEGPIEIDLPSSHEKKQEAINTEKPIDVHFLKHASIYKLRPCFSQKIKCLKLNSKKLFIRINENVPSNVPLPIRHSQQQSYFTTPKRITKLPTISKRKLPQQSLAISPAVPRAPNTSHVNLRKLSERKPSLQAHRVRPLHIHPIFQLRQRCQNLCERIKISKC